MFKKMIITLMSCIAITGCLTVRAEEAVPIAMPIDSEKDVQQQEETSPNVNETIPDSEVVADSIEDNEIPNAPWKKVEFLDGINMKTGESVKKTECGTVKFRMDIPFDFDDDFIYLECIKMDDMTTWGNMARSYSDYTVNAYFPEGEYLLDFCRASEDQYGDYRIEPITFTVTRNTTQILTIPFESIYPTEQEILETESAIAELETIITQEEKINDSNSKILVNPETSANDQQLTITPVTEQKEPMPAWIKAVGIVTGILITSIIIVIVITFAKKQKK